MFEINKIFEPVIGIILSMVIGNSDIKKTSLNRSLSA